MNNLVEKIEQHFNDTPLDEILHKWESVCSRCRNDDSPNVEQYLRYSFARIALDGLCKIHNNMRKYIGTKEINAKQMTRQEYNDFRGRELPQDENGSDEGYLVEYIDGGKANTPQFSGYVSWSPKDVFERAYKSIETPRDRLCIEFNELQEKYNKLVLFLGRKDAEQIAGEMQVALMKRQKVDMKVYLITLKARIGLMKK